MRDPGRVGQCAMVGGGRFWRDTYIDKVEPKKYTRTAVTPSSYLQTIVDKEACEFCSLGTVLSLAACAGEPL